MDTARSMLMDIHRTLKGDLSLLAENAETMDEDEAQSQFTALTSAAVWEALYVLAAKIDAK